ncbi:MAG: hypothetical protein KC731_23315 [Myxococcales bacterium]|nr:hypothetical protein [Myxococcales bacterium]
MHSQLSPHQIRLVSVEAARDPRTVRKYFDGEPVSSMSAAAIAGALKRLGLEGIATMRTEPIGGAAMLGDVGDISERNGREPDHGEEHQRTENQVVPAHANRPPEKGKQE